MSCVFGDECPYCNERQDVATFMILWYEVDDQTQHVAYTHTEEDAKTVMHGLKARSDDVRWAQWYRSIGDANDLPGEEASHDAPH